MKSFQLYSIPATSIKSTYCYFVPCEATKFCWKQLKQARSQENRTLTRSLSTAPILILLSGKPHDIYRFGNNKARFASRARTPLFSNGIKLPTADFNSKKSVRVFQKKKKSGYFFHQKAPPDLSLVALVL